jgi:hypothetical protein
MAAMIMAAASVAAWRRSSVISRCGGSLAAKRHGGERALGSISACAGASTGHRQQQAAAAAAWQYQRSEISWHQNGIWHQLSLKRRISVNNMAIMAMALMALNMAKSKAVMAMKQHRNHHGENGVMAMAGGEESSMWR